MTRLDAKLLQTFPCPIINMNAVVLLLKSAKTIMHSIYLTQYVLVKKLKKPTNALSIPLKKY
jgi:hypothetical protein